MDEQAIPEQWSKQSEDELLPVNNLSWFLEPRPRRVLHGVLKRRVGGAGREHSESHRPRACHRAKACPGPQTAGPRPDWQTSRVSRP